jgi:hypothetical protein
VLGKRYKRIARFFAAFPDWSRKKCAQIHKINPQFECCRDTGPSSGISAGNFLPPLIRQQMFFIASWPAFAITPAVREKLLSISPTTIDRVLKNDKVALALKGKSFTKPGKFLKHLISTRTFYTSEERKLPGFIQIDTGRL